jgi:hypothetical protein
MDTSRELRAMIMASLPCPPLPLEGHEKFINSHDMLAYLMDVAARRDNPVENETRRIIQEYLIKNYVETVGTCITEDELWRKMTMFTRNYMMSYNYVMHEARFSPFDAMTLPLKIQVCSWLAAQHILNGDETAVGDQFKEESPLQLYNMCRDIIHVAGYDAKNGMTHDTLKDIFFSANLLTSNKDQDLCIDGSTYNVGNHKEAEAEQSEA